MTITVNVHEAKTQFSKLLARVGLGEEVIIAKAGKPVARLMPFAEKARPRTPGSAAGKLAVMPDFDAPLPQSVLASFEAGCSSPKARSNSFRSSPRIP